MRRSAEAGFTLIELLLVLAIIGIISAIAIPALLGQRTRSRDKAAVTNAVGILGDLVGQFDKAQEAGVPATAALDAYLGQTVSKVPSPWGGDGFNPITRVVSGAATMADFEAAMAPNAATILGKVRVYIQLPANGDPGFIGTVTNLSDSVVYRKATALD